MDEKPENAQLQREFLVSLNFLVSLGNETNKKYLNSLREREIIDIESLNNFDYIIPRAIELKDGLEFIIFDKDSLFLIRRCLESVKELSAKLFEPSTVAPNFNIIINIERIKERISYFQLNYHEGNLNFSMCTY